MVNRRSRAAGALLAVVLAALLPAAVAAQWAAQPGETVRNGFGPTKSGSASMCRGACGLGCPASCKQRVAYECLDSGLMRRVTTYICSTHQACRDHDDCLDACMQQGMDRLECDTHCHAEVVEAYGMENAMAWAGGGGPTDGPPIFFQYSQDAPNLPEPAFRCPESAELQCARGKGRCLLAGVGQVDPVFDSYPATDSMRIANLRAGPLCGEEVCEQATVIAVTGGDVCERGACTRYGVEFDYQGANPALPLECSGEVTGGGDFIGGLLKKGAAMVPEQGDGSGEDGMAELIGMFQKVLNSADAPEDVQVTVTPADEKGNPLEAVQVGSNFEGPLSVPKTVVIPAADGRLLVPMYQLVDVPNQGSRQRKLRCSHGGQPVLEVDFQLQF